MKSRQYYQWHQWLDYTSVWIKQRDGRTEQEWERSWRRGRMSLVCVTGSRPRESTQSTKAHTVVCAALLWLECQVNWAPAPEDLQFHLWWFTFSYSMITLFIIKLMTIILLLHWWKSPMAKKVIHIRSMIIPQMFLHWHLSKRIINKTL